MLAIAATILAVLAGLDVKLGSISAFDLLCFAVACMALHLAFPLPVRGRR